MLDYDPVADVLVVIPCLNEEDHLPVLLPCIMAQAEGCVVVVADGGSTDGSRGIVRALSNAHPRLILLDNPKQTQSAAVNLAARLFGSGKKWLLRIDAHADYPSDFVRCLLSAAKNEHATSVVVPMVTIGKSCFQRAAAAAQNSILGTGGAAHRHVRKGQWVEHGHHALVAMDLFMRAGGYDESFVANEDAELDRRLLSAGCRIWLEPGAAITYYPRPSVRKLFKQYRMYGMGRSRNLRRHRTKIRLRQLLPLTVVPAILLAFTGLALSPVTSMAWWLVLPVLCWAAASLSAGIYLGARARCICAAGSGIAAMTMHAGWSFGFLMEACTRKQIGPPPAELAFTVAA